ncbi:beta-glucoside-specific PTS transporter subunit IIABC [Luteococcus sp. H138]|uniref:beta-glucoside-specific PTS transporter subunit IIABC n=1 Tax=unclassified Luteococcus TaxID=2639923 RepID=UPI00313D3E7C
MGNKDLAASIVEKVGGPSNVVSVGHCATRLRFQLADATLADTTALLAVKGVVDVVEKGGQYQIVIGPGVQALHREVSDAVGAGAPSGDQVEDPEQGIVGRVLGIIAGAFFPIVPAIVGGGMLKAVAAILLATMVLTPQSPTYVFLNFMGDAAFYFLPVLLGVSAAQKFKVNPYVAGALGAMLIHPAFSQMVTAARTGGPTIEVFGLPVQPVNYASSVIPIFLMVWLQSYVEPLANKIMPKAVHMVSTPLLTSFVVGLVGFLGLAPLGNWIGMALGSGVTSLSQTAPWLVPGLMGAFTPLLVMTGMHYGIIPVGINLLATTGKDPVVGPGMLVSNVAQGGAALAVALRAKNVNTKSLAGSSGFTAVLGITEPALYGVNLRFKRPLIAAMIGGGIGGLLIGFMGVGRFAQVAPGLLALPSYIDPKNPANLSVLIWAVVGVAVAFASAFAITLVWGIDESADAAKASVPGPAEDSSALPAVAGPMDTEIQSPLAGEVLPLESVKDAVFARGALGPGVAVVPSEGRLVAPADGAVTVMFPTGHAVGLATDAGAELLMHVGLDTVQLQGEHFTTHVAKGDRVTRGDLLVEFDVEAIAAAGYDLTTPVVITNSKSFGAVRPVANGRVRVGDTILTLTV